MSIRFITNNPIIIDKVNTFVENWQSASDKILVHTSGSTGNPKTIPLSKSYMKASAIATGKFLGLKTGDTALLCLSTDTIGGKMMLIRTLVLNLDLIVSEVSSSPLDRINEKVDFTAMVPMQVKGCLEKTPKKLNHIAKLIIGGAPVSDSLIEELQVFSCKAFSTFGMTETISHIALRSLNQPREESFSTLPDISITASIDGHLEINAPMLGVSKLITNDIIEMVSPQQFKWLGRSDFVINSGGIKIHPEEIESNLSTLIVEPFFVSSLHDDLLGEKLILNIESIANNLEKTHLTEHLGRFKSPKEIHLYLKFHYTISGKIDRAATLKDKEHVIRKVL